MSAWVMFWVFVTVVAILVAFKDPLKAAAHKWVDGISAKSVEKTVEDKLKVAVQDMKSHVSTAVRNSSVAITSTVKQHVAEALKKQSAPAPAPAAPAPAAPAPAAPAPAAPAPAAPAPAAPAPAAPAEQAPPTT